MKKKLAALCLFALWISNTKAQQLPQSSPLGQVEQIVGITKMNLEYSRPSVKGRVVWGNLVPYGEVWRLGANASTKLETSTDITIGTKTISKGKYALYAIPAENGDWVIVLNSDTTLQGAFGYDKTKDVLRINTKAMINSFTETLSIDFDKITPSSAVISIKWGKIRVDVPFAIATEKLVKESIAKMVKNAKEVEKTYERVAFSYFNIGDYKEAIAYADRSLDVKTTGRALFTKARSLQGQGKTERAVKLANHALELVRKTNKGFALFIENNIKAWNE